MRWVVGFLKWAETQADYQFGLLLIKERDKRIRGAGGINEAIIAFAKEKNLQIPLELKNE